MMVSIKKTKSDRYTLQGDSDVSWANIVIDEHWGLLLIHSDYGNWSFAWPHHGRESLRHFLLEARTSQSYFMTKLAGGERHFDQDATERLVRKEILKLRRERGLTKDDARDAWFRTDSLFEYNSKDLYHHAVMEDDVLFKKVFGQDYENIPCVMTYDPGLIAFFERVWPHFLNELKLEISIPSPMTTVVPTIDSHSFNGA